MVLVVTLITSSPSCNNLARMGCLHQGSAVPQEPRGVGAESPVLPLREAWGERQTRSGSSMLQRPGQVKTRENPEARHKWALSGGGVGYRSRHKEAQPGLKLGKDVAWGR